LVLCGGGTYFMVEEVGKWNNGHVVTGFAINPIIQLQCILQDLKMAHQAFKNDAVRTQHFLRL
jgi:hypothetical protein